MIDEKKYNTKMVQLYFSNLFKLFLEKNDFVRDKSGEIIMNLLKLDPELLYIPNKSQLLEMFNQKEFFLSDINTDEVSYSFIPKNVYPLLKRLFELDAYRDYALEGIFVSVGDKTQYINKISSEVFIKWSTSLNGPNIIHLNHTINLIIKLFDKYEGNNRMLLPLFKISEICIDQGLFNKINQPEKLYLILIEKMKQVLKGV